MNDNIKNFPGSSNLPENPMQVADRPLGCCRHNSILSNPHTRSIQCADPKCSAMLEPFDYLLSNARSISSAWSVHRDVMRQEREANERVSKLKKKEKRLRGMVKRLQKKSGAVVMVRSDRLL